MKKKLVIVALATLAIFGTAVYLHAESSIPSLKDAGTLSAGTKCIVCNGTGFQGYFNCAHCRGTGRNANY